MLRVQVFLVSWFQGFGISYGYINSLFDACGGGDADTNGDRGIATWVHMSHVVKNAAQQGPVVFGFG